LLDEASQFLFRARARVEGATSHIFFCWMKLALATPPCYIAGKETRSGHVKNVPMYSVC